MSDQPNHATPPLSDLNYDLSIPKTFPGLGVQLPSYTIDSSLLREVSFYS